MPANPEPANLESANSGLAAAQPIRRIERDGIRYTLIGTAHVSRASAEAVKAMASSDEFDAIAVELCPARYDALKADRNWSDLDLYKIVREGKAGLVMANLALSAYQRRIAEQFGIEPGAEMRAAAAAALQRGVPLQLIDRDLATTLRRSYASVPWYKRFYLMTGLALGMVSSDEIDEEAIERLKEGDILESTFTEFAEQSPELYEALISERDRYMAARLRQENAQSARNLAARNLASGNLAAENLAEGKATEGQPAAQNALPRNILVVIGAGHMEGMSEALQTDQAQPDVVRAELDQLPPKSRWPVIVPWAIMILVLAGFAIGFSRSPTLGWELVATWVLINGGLAALGTLIARGHPVTIVSAFIAAPMTTLNPAIAVGMVTGLVESWLRKPRVSDLERLRFDITTVKGWFTNPATRILLVFFFSNLGAAIGTWVAGFRIFGALS